MIWYLLNILIVTIAYLWPTKVTEDDVGQLVPKATRKRVCIVGSIGWIILSGFRHLSVGADTEAYKIHSFDAIYRQPWDKLFQNVYDKYFLGKEIKDPGYEIVEKLVDTLTGSYRIHLILVAILFFVALGFFIYRLSSNPYISYVLFSTLFYSFFAITGIRQTIATAFTVLIGTFLIKEKKLIRFLIVTLLASTIHMSCLCFIPFYFVSKIKINKATLIMYWGAIAGSFALRYQLLEFLQSIIGYETYQDFEGASAGTFLYLLLAMGAVTTFFHKKLLDGNETVMRLSINALMLSCFFSPLLLINQSTMRLVQYFSIFLMIILPEISKIFPKKNDKTVFNIAIVLVLIALFALQGSTYKFFWE